MRIFVRVAAGLALLLVALIVATVLILPPYLESEELQARIRTETEAALGREFDYASLELGLLPPSLVVESPRIAGVSPEAPPLLEARSVALRVALLPLFVGAVVIDSFVVEEASLQLVRTQDGFLLPEPPPRPREAGSAPRDPRAESGSGDEAPVDLAVRGVALRNSTLVIEDRSVSPPVTWTLRNVNARARGDSLDAPFEFESSFDIEDGGSVAASGSASMGGEIDMQVEVADLDLGRLAPYLEDAPRLAGIMTGTLAARGPAENPSHIEADLELRDAHFRLDDVDVKGLVVVKADVEGGVEAPNGNFDLDATDAELHYGDVFIKPRGVVATVRGRFVNESDGGIGVDDVELRVKNFEARVEVSMSESTRVKASVTPFDLEGWDALVPAVEGYALAGSVRPGEFTVNTDPLDVRGTLGLDGVRARLPDAGALELRGGIIAEGQSVRTDGLALIAGGQPIAVDGVMNDLAGTPSYRVKTNATDVDTNLLVTALTGKRDAITGRMRLSSDVSGTIEEKRPPAETAAGSARFEIRDGRIVGVSLLQSTFGRLSGIAAVAGSLFAGPGIEHFYGDEFKTISATLELAGGVLRTDDFRIDYGSYSVDLAGTLGVTSLAIDMRGSLTIGPEIDAALRRQQGGAGGEGRTRTIQLAAVKGTLDEPRVTVTGEAIQTFAGLYGLGALGGERGDELETYIDRKLGEGSGRAVRDALEGLLGGGRRSSQ